MKRIFSALLFLACSAANAQFVTGQILTAAQLNAAFANVLATSGGTLTGPLTVQGSTTVANLTVNGTFTVPGGFSPGSLSPQAANSLLGNASGTTQAPGVVAVPSCSASGSALKWTSASGLTCGTGYALTANPLSQFAATTSAQLAGVISDESGSGSLLFGTSPTIATPAISGGTINNASVGATTASTGAFTTLSATGAISGAGFTSLLSPYAPLASASPTGTWAFAARPTFNGNTPYDTGNVVAIANGGTGQATASAARIALGAAATGANVDITSLASPALGAATATTQTAGTSNTTVATTNYVTTQIASGTQGAAFTTISATGLISPTSTVGIKGTTTNDSANAGSVGEFPTPADLTSVSLTSNSSANCSSVSLTAGDWEVGGMVQIAAAASTLITNSFGGVSTTSAALGALGTYWQIANNFSAGALVGLPVPTTRISIASTTTVYLVVNAGFTTSTATASCKMHVRRPR